MITELDFNTPSAALAELPEPPKRDFHKLVDDLKAFVRSCGVSGKVSPVPSINVQQWAQLAATTSNLNQLTRLAHQGRVSADIADAVQTAAHLLREIRTSLIGGH